MATAILCRRAVGRRLVPLTLSLSSGVWLLSHQKPMRFDAPSAARPRTEPPLAERLDPNVIKQLSGGSLSGFLTGLLVSAFSRTLVLVIGLTIVTIQVASRYGVDLVQQLRLKERVRASKVLSSLRENTPFKLSFGITFAMSAFMHF